MRWGYVANVCIDNKNLDFIFEMMGGQTLRTHEQWDGVMSYAQHKQQHSCGSRGGSSQACRRDGIHQRHGDQSGLPWRAISQESASNAGDLGLIPGSRRSPGEGNGYPLQYSCLENSRGRGAWQKSKLNWNEQIHYTRWRQGAKRGRPSRWLLQSAKFRPKMMLA